MTHNALIDQFKRESALVQAHHNRDLGAPRLGKRRRAHQHRRSFRWRAAFVAAIYAASPCSPRPRRRPRRASPSSVTPRSKTCSRTTPARSSRRRDLAAQNSPSASCATTASTPSSLDGRNVFINSGTLMQAKTPNEVIGVIAHETGHIAGGHMAALRARIARDPTKALLVAILGIGLMVGGAVSGSDTGREIAGSGSGLMMGGNECSCALCSSERRSQESAADQAGLRYLEATRQSGKGMLQTFEGFAQQDSLGHLPGSVCSQPPDCIRQAGAVARERRQSPYVNAKDRPQLQSPRHDAGQAHRLSGTRAGGDKLAIL